MTLNDIKAIWKRIPEEDRQAIILAVGFVCIITIASLAIIFLLVEELLFAALAAVILTGLKVVVYNPIMKAWREHDESIRTLEERYPHKNHKNSTGTGTESNSE